MLIYGDMPMGQRNCVDRCVRPNGRGLEHRGGKSGRGWGVAMPEMTPNIEPDALRRRKILTRVMAGRAFMIKTSPAASYLLKVKSWLTTGSHGAIIYGRPRLGKTMATRWVLRMLRQVIGYVPSVEVPIRKQRIASEREFFQHLLHCARHEFYDVGSAGDRRDRLTEWLVTRARRSPVNAAVLFFDEAHFLTDHHYSWLLNIDNELDMRGCRLFCLLVGQPELAEKKLDLIDKGMEQIVGRFMVREFEFPGIRTLEQLTESFKEFSQTEYPAGSGTTFPYNFIPQAVESGFRLENLAPATWSAFGRLWSAAGVDEEFEIPMHYLTAALTEILDRVTKSDRPSLTVSDPMVNKCVAASGYLESLRAQKASAKDA